MVGQYLNRVNPTRGTGPQNPSHTQLPVDSGKFNFLTSGFQHIFTFQLSAYSKMIFECHQLVETALSETSKHSDEILIQITSFLNGYPRKPTYSTSTPAGSVYTTLELMRQAIVRS